MKDLYKENTELNINSYLLTVQAYLYEKYGNLISFEDFSKNLNKKFKTNIFISFNEVDLLKINTKNLKNLSIFEISLLYESFKNDNKKQGRFYTPLNLVEEMCSLIHPKKNDYKILDPACGTGIFLIFILEKIKKNFNSYKELFDFVESNFYFIDLDNVSLELTRVFLLTSIFTDFNELIDSSLLKENGIASNALLDTNKILNTKYDLIIGNPPYGLSRDNQIEKLELEALKTKYKSFFKAKLNKYLVFLYVSFLTLKDTGELVFVVPNAWLGVKSGLEFRKLLLKSKSLKSVYIYKSEVFPKASVEAVVVHINRSNQNNSINLITKDSPFDEVLNNVEYKYSDFSNSQDAMIPTRWSNTASNVFKLINENSNSIKDLSNLFKPAIAMQAYSKGKGTPKQTEKIVNEHSFHNEIKLADDYYPYLIGKDIKRFSYDKENSYLKYGKHLAEPQTLDRFSGERIVLREILGKTPYYFQACIINETALYNKSCLHILLIDKTKINELYALCCILNSKVGSYILHYLGRKSQRKTFPKIVNDDLLNFPFPNIEANSLDNFKKLYEKINSSNNVLEFQEELDNSVYEIFKIKEFKKEIEEELIGT